MLQRSQANTGCHPSMYKKAPVKDLFTVKFQIWLWHKLAHICIFTRFTSVKDYPCWSFEIISWPIDIERVVDGRFVFHRNNLIFPIWNFSLNSPNCTMLNFCFFLLGGNKLWICSVMIKFILHEILLLVDAGFFFGGVQFTFELWQLNCSPCWILD